MKSIYRGNKKRTFLTLLLYVTFITNGFSQPGTRDSTFGSNGVVLTYIQNGCKAYAATAQSDGKIVAVGTVDSPGPLNYAWGLARYNVNGTPDNSFGDGNGYEFISLGLIAVDERATSVAIGSDGKIAVGGYAGSHYVLALFNADGSLDTNFANVGFLFIDTIQLDAVAIQDDGKIIAAGTSDAINHYLFSLSRYNTNGSLDTTFNGNGIVTTSIDNYGCFIGSIVIQPDNKIVAAGGKLTIGLDRDFALARYNIDGSLDSTFNGSGILVTANEISNEIISSVALDSNGKIVVVGSSYTSTSGAFAIARYNTDGSTDTNFGTNGKTTTAINSISDVPYSFAFQSDGKMVVAGSSLSNQNFYFALARYNSDGTLDTTFGINGTFTDSFNSVQYQIAFSVIVQSDDKIIAVGFSGPYFALARYLSGFNVGVLDFFLESEQLCIYSNPIHSQATLQYTLTNKECITISLYNMQGSKVQTFIINETRNQGEHKEVLDLDEALPSGEYILSISNGVHNQSIKITKI